MQTWSKIVHCSDNNGNDDDFNNDANNGGHTAVIYVLYTHSHTHTWV